MSKKLVKTYVVGSEPVELVKADKIVQHLVPKPRSQIRALFQNKCVYVDGALILNPGSTLKKGQVLELRYEEGRGYREVKSKDTAFFKVVFEDGHLVVVDKEAGVLSVPTRSEKEDTTLFDELSMVMPSSVKLHVVHRLDRDTSGLLVFAKSHGVCKALKEQFEERKPERLYDAFVWGRVLPEQGTFKTYLATDQDLNQYSVKTEKKGKLAVTHYEVEKYFEKFTWVKVTLETGRRNQIRVHFSENGYPLLGDTRYGSNEESKLLWGDKLLALHASTLGFRHPITNKNLRFESGLPSRMKELL